MSFLKRVGQAIRRVVASICQFYHSIGSSRFFQNSSQLTAIMVGLPLLGSTLVAGVILTGCSGGSTRTNIGLSPRVIPLGRPVPKGGGRYKVGKPYQIAGRWYYPTENQSYDRQGIASWYGEKFHGRYTSNGEIYDMDALTAAHPTLPMPTYAQVTNLRNGRTIVVRVNDRGPYKHDRIIDLSRRSANLLGFARNGTAPVRVRYLGRAPINGDDRYERRFLAQQRWHRPRYAGRQEGPLHVGTIARSRPSSYSAASGGQGGLFIQVGSFSNPQNAERMRHHISRVGPAHITEKFDARSRGQRALYQVKLGPYAHGDEARAVLEKVVGAGVRDAVIIKR